MRYNSNYSSTDIDCNIKYFSKKKKICYELLITLTLLIYIIIYLLIDIEFSSSIFVTNAGHGNKKIIASINRILNKPLLHSYYYPTLIRLKILRGNQNISFDLITSET